MPHFFINSAAIAKPKPMISWYSEVNIHMEVKMSLEKVRETLDKIDAQIADLFYQRMEVIDRIAVIKAGSGAPVHHPEREKQVTDRLLGLTGTQYQEELLALYDCIFRISRSRQEKHITDKADHKG